jgi:hypothetical protein
MISLHNIGASWFPSIPRTTNTDVHIGVTTWQRYLIPVGLPRTYRTQYDPVAVRAFISEQRRATTVACENSYMLMVGYALFQT